MRFAMKAAPVPFLDLGQSSTGSLWPQSPLTDVSRQGESTRASRIGFASCSLHCVQKNQTRRRILISKE